MTNILKAKRKKLLDRKISKSDLDKKKNRNTKTETPFISKNASRLSKKA